MKHSTNLVIISGPSGAGEDSVINGLIERGIPVERVITTITRPMRSGESEGKPYYFISDEEFQNRINKDEFIEWADVYGVKRGVTKQELSRVQEQKGKVGIWKIDWHGVLTAKKLFPDILAILISVPNIDDLVERLRRRGDSEKQIQNRIAFTREWMKHKDVYDIEIPNEQGKLDQAITRVTEALKKEDFLDKQA